MKARKDEGELGIEAPLFGRGEVVGDPEGGEIVEGAANMLEMALELGRARGDGDGAGLGVQAPERVTQERAAVGLVGGLKHFDQSQGLARGEPVALGAVEKPVLVLGAELAQGARESWADGAGGELGLGGR